MVDKVNPAAAINAYKNMQGIGQGARVSGNDDGASFLNLIKNAATDSIDTMRRGEKVSAEAVAGTADLTDVVEAVTAAEMTLQTVVAVRDRLLGAYQELMRLPI